MSINSSNEHNEFNRYVERHDAHMIGGQILTPDHTIVTPDQQQRIHTGVDDRKRGHIDRMFITGRSITEVAEIQTQMSPYADLVENIDFTLFPQAREMLQRWMQQAFRAKKGVCVISDFSTGFQGGVFRDVMDMEERHNVGARRILVTDRHERDTKAACREYGIHRPSIYSVHKPKSDDIRIQTEGPWMQKLHALFRQ